MYLFHEEIQHWKDWERIFFSIPVFSPLIKKIMQIEIGSATAFATSH